MNRDEMIKEIYAFLKIRYRDQVLKRLKQLSNKQITWICSVVNEHAFKADHGIIIEIQISEKSDIIGLTWKKEDGTTDGLHFSG